MLDAGDKKGCIEGSYVLVTPARDEERHIEETIKAVISQTVIPQRWIIVDDGSVDGTAQIVKKYESRYDFINLVQTSGSSGRDFASKVRAFNAGFETVKREEFYFIGNLDGDVSFEERYYEYIIKRFHLNPKLGIAGGVILEKINGGYVSQRTSLNSVAGPVQLFRRACYEAIGGYIPIQSGGIDAAAEIMARAKGWEVESFPEIFALHNRRMVTGKSNILFSRFQQGMKNYRLGYHPIFQTVSSLYRMADRPLILGGGLMLAGYLWSLFKGERRILPDDVRRYLRLEQTERIKSLLLRGPGTRTRKKI
jgi:glycosyltransferase involved in cell wall biosynthesis